MKASLPSRLGQDVKIHGLEFERRRAGVDSAEDLVAMHFAAIEKIREVDGVAVDVYDAGREEIEREVGPLEMDLRGVKRSGEIVPFSDADKPFVAVGERLTAGGDVPRVWTELDVALP